MFLECTLEIMMLSRLLLPELCIALTAFFSFVSPSRSISSVCAETESVTEQLAIAIQPMRGCPMQLAIQITFPRWRWCWSTERQFMTTPLVPGCDRKRNVLYCKTVLCYRTDNARIFLLVEDERGRQCHRNQRTSTTTMRTTNARAVMSARWQTHWTTERI